MDNHEKLYEITASASLTGTTYATSEDEVIKRFWALYKIGLITFTSISIDCKEVD